jgi:hypothetical protein
MTSHSCCCDARSVISLHEAADYEGLWTAQIAETKKYIFLPKIWDNRLVRSEKFQKINTENILSLDKFIPEILFQQP